MAADLPRSGGDPVSILDLDRSVRTSFRGMNDECSVLGGTEEAGQDQPQEI
jgi:hypothetical protein